MFRLLDNNDATTIRMPYTSHLWLHTACKEWETCIFYR